MVVVEKMPLTPNGKVDRKSLPAPEGLGWSEEYHAPQTAEERAVAEIWEEVLKAEGGKISRRANFFELGGNSLTAMQVVSRVRRVLGVEVALRELFEAPVLAGFAQRIWGQLISMQVEGEGEGEGEEGRGRGRRFVQAKIGKREGGKRLRLSYAQQRLWVLDQVEGGSVQYNLPVALRVKGKVDEGALQRALDRVVERHEVLRTRYVGGEQGAEQVVEEAVGVRIERVDLSELGKEEREARLLELARAEVVRGFDLEHDLMLRVTLIGLEEAEQVVLFTQHHIASDGWSMGILVEEFGRLYEAYAGGRKIHWRS